MTTGKVTKQLARTPVKTASRAAPKPPPPTAKPADAPSGLSERALRRTGKASGFSRTFPALPSSPPQSAAPSEAPVLRAGSASSMQQLRAAGGQLPTTPEGLQKAEGAVAFNTAHTKEWTLAELKKNPKAFLKNVVQLDGALSSTVDRTACGPTALLMGMIAGRPESMQELASKLVTADGSFTTAGRNLASKLTPEFREELQGALSRLREGKGFTPADITTVASAIQGVEKLAGAAPNDLKEAAIAIERLGVKVPPMELQLFGKSDGSMGHWRVVSQGTQFNPWPNDRGQSTQLPAKQGIEAGKSDGAGWVLRDTVSVGSN